MGFDALLKKYFLAAVLVLVAVAAFFQARGAMQLVGAMLIPEATALAVLAPVPSGGVRSSTAPKSAEPILARNPFDFSTGPLNAKTLAEGLPAGEVAAPADPLRAPACQQIKVSIITESGSALVDRRSAGPGGPAPDDPARRRRGGGLEGAVHRV